MKLEAIDVGLTASASDLVYERLRKAIVEGQLSEGEKLGQDQIARLFNTSRIPVREALSRLEHEGLVTVQRFKGAVVAALSADEIKEIFELRALLEGEIMRLAVPNMDKATLERARQYCHEFATEAQAEKWGEINKNFHYTLYEAAKRPYHLQVIRSALDKVDRYLRAQLILTDGMDRAKRDHQAIFDACATGDAERAAALTSTHILDASAALVKFLAKQRGQN